MRCALFGVTKTMGYRSVSVCVTTKKIPEKKAEKICKVSRIGLNAI